MTFPYDGSELSANEPPLKKPWYRRIDPLVVMTLMIIGFTIFVFMAISNGSKTKELESKENQLTLNDAYAALFRTFKTQKICFVEERNGYFILFDKDDTKDDNWDGWFYFKGPQFYLNKANKTWFVTNIPDSEFVRVWPNVDGMNCGEAKDYEDK